MTIRDFIQLSILKPNKIWTILQNPLKKKVKPGYKKKLGQEIRQKQRRQNRTKNK